MKPFDVVIVGARCAGSPLAAMLARRGIGVCLVDRARFPSETPSTHVIQPCGVQILDQLGVLKDLLAAGAVPLEHFTMVNDDVRIECRADLFEHPALCVRRLTLDALLVQQAAAAGAEVRTGAPVRRLINDDGRVAGVQTDDGPIRARLVVGADGRHSTVASAVGAREYHVSPPGRMAAWGYFEGAVRDGHFRIGRMGDMGFLASPTDGDLYMAAVAPDLVQQPEFHADRNGCFTAAIQMWPELADIVSGGRRVGPVRVVTKWHGYFRQSAGSGWVLVGDAGHFKDFAPGQGISDAFRQAQQLANTIENGLGTTNLDIAIQQWWRWRDDDAYEMYRFASVVGQPGASSPLTTSLLRAISANPDATRSFLRVINHDLRPSQLFTSATAARATVRAIRDEPAHIVATLKEAFATGKQNIRESRRKRAKPPGMSDTVWHLL